MRSSSFRGSRLRPTARGPLVQPKLQVCPTRIDGTPVLFAHKVDKQRCQERQRQRYHKCFTCAWNHNQVALHGEPEPAREGASSAEARAATASAG